MYLVSVEDLRLFIPNFNSHPLRSVSHFKWAKLFFDDISTRTLYGVYHYRLPSVSVFENFNSHPLRSVSAKLLNIMLPNMPFSFAQLTIYSKSILQILLSYLDISVRIPCISHVYFLFAPNFLLNNLWRYNSFDFFQFNFVIFKFFRNCNFRCNHHRTEYLC